MKSKSKKTVIYAIMLLLIAASFVLLIWVYLLKCPFDIHRRRVLQDKPDKTYENGGMRIETDSNDFNARLFDYIGQSGALPSGISLQGVAYIFEDGLETPGELYINVTSDKFFGTVFSFYCRPLVSLGNNYVNVALSDIRLGTYKIPYIGMFFWRSLNLPESAAFPAKSADGLMYLSKAETEGDGKIVFTYDYDSNVLAQSINEILEMADERKTEFHAESGTVDSALVQMAQNKQVSPEGALELIKSFEKSPDTFVTLCFLLKDDGIEKLYDLFGEAYCKSISVDRLAEASENEMDTGLNEFNKRFARSLLHYLYLNPDYDIFNGALYSSGRKITPEDVLTGFDGLPYNVRIVADSKSIKAVYSISDEEHERIILTN